MLRKSYMIIMAILVLGLAVSGCTDNTSQEEEAISESVESTDASIAEETLNDEMVGVTDSEIQDIEAELAELEALINEMDQEEDISVEEI